MILRPVQKEDQPFLYQWHMDPDTRHLWNQDREAYGYDRFTEKFLRKIRNRYDLFFMIQKKSGNDPIGFVYDYGFDSVDRVAFICLFTDKAVSGRGNGIEGAVAFMSHLFLEYGLRKLYSEVYGFNRQALAIARKAGFKEEGCLKDHRFWNGRLWDQHIFSMTAQDFFKRLDPFKRYFTGP